ncbi:MAG: hypothetical protein WD969_04760 [Paracoccaceae bacterium]
MKIQHLLAATAVFAVSAGAVFAAPVNGTGDITPAIIFGDGNANGSFTGETRNNVEVGLRGKQRYPSANVFNYDGDQTYTFDSTVLNTNPANRSVFNFEWAINVDASGTAGSFLSDFSYLLSVDTDASAAINFGTIDPFSTPGYFDHALGLSSTPAEGGVESLSLAELQTNMSAFSVAQQSSNLGFGFSADPDAPGIYDFMFQVFSLDGTTLLSSSAITVRVAPVPLPAALPLFVLALGGLAFMRSRRAA